MIEIGTATNYLDLLVRLNTFLTTNGSAFGVVRTGTGNGRLTAYRGGPSSIAETWTLTATSATNFTVNGSVSGAQAAATVGTPYTAGSLVAFTINAGGTAFVAGDTFVFSTAPPWQSLRAIRGVSAVSVPSQATNQPPQYLWDHDRWTSAANSYWQTASGQTATIEFTLGAAVTIVEYAMQARDVANPTTMARDWTLQYWDGAAWQVADTRATQTTWGQAERRIYSVSGGPFSSDRWRIVVTAANTTTLAIQNIELRSTASGVDQLLPQFIWRGPGNDGLGNVYVGCTSWFHTGADYYNWELVGLDGYTAAVNLFQQPGAFRQNYVPLWNSSIPYWFVANGRRFIVIARVNTQYECIYGGLIAPYFSPGQWGYPMALGVPFGFIPGFVPGIESALFRWSNASDDHHTFPKQGSGSRTDVTSNFMRVRDLDGAWRGANEGMWPRSVGGSVVNNLRPNLDGTYPLIPIYMTVAAPNVWGQPDGVFWTTGHSLAAEAILGGTNQENFLAVPDVFRTTRSDFFAVRLD